MHGYTVIARNISFDKCEWMIIIIDLLCRPRSSQDLVAWESELEKRERDLMKREHKLILREAELARREKAIKEREELLSGKDRREKGTYTFH